MDSLSRLLKPKDESTTLLSKDSGNNSKVSLRYFTRKCLTSKAAILILVWCVFVTITYNFIDHLHSLYNIPQTFGQISFSTISYGLSIFLDYFYPLAGFLADVKLSRYKVVFGSVLFMLVAILLLLPGVGVLVTAFVFAAGVITKEVRVLLVVLGCIVALPGVVLLFVGYVGFKANVIQFGLDQLYDFPGDHQVVFLHWLVWAVYLGKAVYLAFSNTLMNYYYMDVLQISFSAIGAAFVVIAIVLVATLYMAYKKKEWFLLQSKKGNPYTLVCKITRFAWKHKAPLRRSAFTFCEDEIPNRFDFGKHKYGGPFTTEQVEDVKAFYGILKVLAAFGSIFVLDIATNPIASLFYMHMSNRSVYSSTGTEVRFTNSNILQRRNSREMEEILFLDSNFLSCMFVVICIPLYLFLLRPFLHFYIPGPLKRMGIGYFISLMLVMLMFVLETVLHSRDRSLDCFLDSKNRWSRFQNSNSSEEISGHATPSYLRYLIIMEYFLSALSRMLGYVALNEFICSQSPRSMTGLIIGMSFAVRGVFEIGSAVLLLPLTLRKYEHQFPSCGMIYYAVNLALGVVGLAVFVGVSRKYEYRKRDEINHVQYYVEDYYSKLLK